MNIDVARQRYKDVFLPDVVDNSQGDFLAKHVPMKNLLLLDRSEPTDNDKKHPLTEESIYEQIFSPNEDDQFVLVKGASGAGKSHLIRWFESMLRIHKQENEIVLYIRRADNTLKGTIRQLIELDEIKNLPNHDLYKKLASASTTVPEIELKNTIYYAFINLIESDDGRAGEDERILSNVDRKHLIALLQNSTFKDRLMEANGPIDRIYSKIAENKTFEVNDRAAEFEVSDLEIDSEFRTELINVGADEKARKIADKMLDNPEYVSRLVVYINKFREKVVQRCTGLEPGDLRNVIEEIRQELFKSGKILTILIEDITAASGVDDSLLDALLTNKRGYTDKKLCRINSIVGVADGYYRDNFRTNTKGRIKKFIIVPDEMFNGDENGLVEFFARYLNTVSLTKEQIEAWIKDKAPADKYPVHDVTMGKGWDVCKVNDKEINIFPFTKHAIIYLYILQDITQRNPRAIMRNLIEPYVKDAIESLDRFPVRRNSLVGVDQGLRNKIYNRDDLDDETKIRLTQFMYIWGNGKDEIYEDNGVRYIAGISEEVYKQLGLPLLDGKVVEKPHRDISANNKPVNAKKSETPRKPKEQVKENEQVEIALQEVDKWIEDKDYKLSIGATTKNVRALNDARKNINDFLYNVIDWNAEGISIDAMAKIKGTTSKFLVAFERQTMNSDAVILLPASIESRKIIESFVRWSEEGNKSWDFPNGADYLYRVLRWVESIKPTIVDSILHYNGKTSEYFSFAVAAEFYRQILSGNCKNYQKPENFVPDMLLKKKESVDFNNGHTTKWNDLLRITNGSDGEDARNCVLQYYNLPQGTSISSTNYEMDYMTFIKAVRKVINKGLKYTDDDLQLDDPIRKRRLFSEYLKKILDRVPTVVSDEKAAVQQKLGLIGTFIDMEDIDDEDDIKDIVKDIRTFYNRANQSHIAVAVNMDNGLLLNCTKNAGAILSAIKNGNKSLQCTDVVEGLIWLSRDPLSWLTPFAELLSKTNNDVIKANEEIEIRSQKASGSNGLQESGQYEKEKQELSVCRAILEEVRK